MVLSTNNDNTQCVDSTSSQLADTSPRSPTASSSSQFTEAMEAIVVSTTPTDSDSVNYGKFTLFPKLALELRYMIVEEVLPEPAILGTLFRHFAASFNH